MDGGPSRRERAAASIGLPGGGESRPEAAARGDGATGPRSLAAVENPFACPHGRPIIVQLGHRGDRAEVRQALTEERSGSGRPGRRHHRAQAARRGRGPGRSTSPRVGLGVPSPPAAACRRTGGEAKGLGVPRGAVLVVEAGRAHAPRGRRPVPLPPGDGPEPACGGCSGARTTGCCGRWTCREGDAVLDATMGLASDLLVASHTVGQSGRAVGVGVGGAHRPGR